MEAIEKARPEHLNYIRNSFEFLETTLLADGRDWVLKTEKPSLADIEGELPTSSRINTPHMRRTASFTPYVSDRRH